MREKTLKYHCKVKLKIFPEIFFKFWLQTIYVNVLNLQSLMALIESFSFRFWRFLLWQNDKCHLQTFTAIRKKVSKFKIKFKAFETLPSEQKNKAETLPQNKCSKTFDNFSRLIPQLKIQILIKESFKNIPPSR